MAKLWLLLLQNPLRSLKFGYTFFAQAAIAILKKLLLPHYPTYLSTRTQIQRAYLSAAILHFPSIVHRLPVTDCPSERALQVGATFTGYLVPGTARLAQLANPDAGPQKRKCVALYAHGGGYVWGEARQYLNYMERWIRESAKEGVQLVFLSVEYPLSGSAQHPAQLECFLEGYKYLLGENVSPNNIIFMGDSAGAAMSIMAGIECRRLSLPQPACMVLISPWLDTSLRDFGPSGSPLVETDYVVTANTSVPAMFNLFRGSHAPDSPSVNPLYRPAGEVAHMCPQLILVGGAETALQDGKDWAQTCRKAGIEHTLVVEWGQLHIYAMGSAWLDPEVRRKTDGRIVSWISDHVQPAE